MIHSVTELSFREEVLLSPRPVLVNFGAAWCGLCQLIQPTLIQFQQRWDDRIKLVNVNADGNLKLASTYKLRTLPTLILISHGQVIDRLEVFRGRDELEDNLDRLSVIATMSWQMGERLVPLEIGGELVAID